MTLRETASRAHQLALWAALAACLSAMFGGSALVATRVLVTQADPLTVTLLRNGIAALILIPCALMTTRHWPPFRDMIPIAFLGTLFYGAFQFALSFGLTYTTSTRAALAATTIPFLTLVVSAVLRIETPSSRKIAGVVIASIGVAIALGPTGKAPEYAWIGDGMIIVGALIGAVYVVLNARYTRSYAPIAVLSIGLAGGLLLLVPIALILPGVAVIPELSVEGWALAAYLGVFAGSLPYFLWLWALRHTTPTMVAVAMPMNPIAAMLLGAALLGERVTLPLIAGLACVIAGILMTNWQARLRRDTALGAPPPRNPNR